MKNDVLTFMIVLSQYCCAFPGHWNTDPDYSNGSYATNVVCLKRIETLSLTTVMHSKTRLLYVSMHLPDNCNAF